MRPDERSTRCRLSLDGLSVGDAFGERFFGEPRRALARIVEREPPPPPWRYTDDTEMALSVVEVLERCGQIDQDQLAVSFARRLDTSRGYGAGALGILVGVAGGVPWRALSQAAMGGQGSFGNGAAMRVAPLGAWFADDLDRAVAQARLSAEVTHAHREGIAGAIAVAAAAALTAARADAPLPFADFLGRVIELTPAGSTRAGLEEALRLGPARPADAAARILGNGSRISAPDTVPFCLWVAARNYPYLESLWQTVSALGDRDTTCAIVGGVVALRDPQGIPREWLAAREPLPLQADLAST